MQRENGKRRKGMKEVREDGDKTLLLKNYLISMKKGERGEGGREDKRGWQNSFLTT